MARTTRRRESDEIVNPHKSSKKKDRRSHRQNMKQRIKEIDYTLLNHDELDDDDEHIVRGIS